MISDVLHDSDSVCAPLSYRILVYKSMKLGILTSIIALLVLLAVSTCSKGDDENITPRPKRTLSV